MPFSAEQCRFRWFLGQEQGSIEQCNGLGSRLTSHRVNISFWFPRTWLNVWAPAPMHSSSSSSNRRSAFKRCSHSGSDKSSEMFCLDKRRENTGNFFLHLNWNTFTFLEAIPKSPWSFAFANQEKKKGMFESRMWNMVRSWTRTCGLLNVICCFTLIVLHCIYSL